MASKTASERNDRLFQLLVIHKLYKLKCIGGRHTSAENIPKGFPPADRKYIEEALEELIKKGVVISKPTGYGLEVSLNSHHREFWKLISEAEEAFIEYQQTKKKGKKKSRSGGLSL